MENAHGRHPVQSRVLSVSRSAFAWALWESIDCSESANDVTTCSSHDSFLEANCSLCICIWIAIIAIVENICLYPVGANYFKKGIYLYRKEGQRRRANISRKFETLREFPDMFYRSIYVDILFYYLFSTQIIKS